MSEPCDVPPGTLLQKYRVDGTFTDCYITMMHGQISLARFVEAFYTTPLFKLERFILGVAGRASTDDDARQLAQGVRHAFAAWTVEARGEDELLLCDVLGRTRSWLMVAPVPGADRVTRLYFGSAVVPKRDPQTGKRQLGTGFRALLGFHKLYSVALLRAARRALELQKRHE